MSAIQIILRRHLRQSGPVGHTGSCRQRCHSPRLSSRVGRFRWVHFHEQIRKTVRQLQIMSHVLRRGTGDTQPTRALPGAVLLAVVAFCAQDKAVWLPRMRSRYSAMYVSVWWVSDVVNWRVIEETMVQGPPAGLGAAIRLCDLQIRDSHLPTTNHAIFACENLKHQGLYFVNARESGIGRFTKGGKLPLLDWLVVRH